MLISILQHTPGWAWLMLAVLLALGLWQRLHRPGSWLPMALIVLVVLIFSLRYTAGVAQGLNPTWQTVWRLQAGQALLFGGPAGRAGPETRPLARHKQSTGLFVSGLGTGQRRCANQRRWSSCSVWQRWYPSRGCT